MLKSGRAGRWYARLAVVREPLFWGFLVAVLAGVTLLVALLAYAVQHHDTFLRLKPVLCEQGISERGFFLVAVAAPLWLALTLAALAELWGQIECRRAGRPARWFHFWWFLVLASGLAALVLLGLGC